MTGLICKCGGDLHRTICEEGYEEYICGKCELEWFRCELCSGSLHARTGDELIHHPDPSA
jgi:hypothetical protein